MCSSALPPHQTESKHEPFYDLFPLYKDIASLPTYTINVQWKTRHKESNGMEETQVVQNVLDLFPKPDIRHFTELYDALHTTYQQAIYRETPRFDDINFVKIRKTAQLEYKRDLKLQRIYEKVRKSGRKLDIQIHSSLQQYSKRFKHAVLAFLGSNKEYCLTPLILQNEQQLKFDDVLEVFYIQPTDVSDHHRALIGQRGLRAKQSIEPYVVLGQYVGNEIEESVYDDIYRLTSAETTHGRYAFELEIAMETQQNIRFVLDPLPLTFDRNRCIDIEFRGSKLIFVNDCRHNVECTELTKADEKLCNVEFVHCDVNGWREVFVITTKAIERGQQIYGFYGQDLSQFLDVDAEYDQRCKELKTRLDAKHAILPRLLH